MKYAPFEGPGAFYRGNMHTHTTRSDGKLTLAENVAIYRRNGYDFLAVTDHRQYYRGGDLDGLILLPGVENDITLQTPGRGPRTHHIVGFGTGEQGFAHDHAFERCESQGPEGAQAVIDALNGGGNLCVYAHPHWSQTNIVDYGPLEGLFGFEVYNGGCDLDCDTGYAHNAWHDLLLHGRRVYAFATDDGHNVSHMGKGWISAFARERSAPAILEAIRAGRFYASCGPEIHSLTIADGVLTVRCSPCRRILLFAQKIGVAGKRLGLDGLMTMAEFPVPEDAPFLRVQCIDDGYRMAWSQPVYLEEVGR